MLTVEKSVFLKMDFLTFSNKEFDFHSFDFFRQNIPENSDSDLNIVQLLYDVDWASRETGATRIQTVMEIKLL
jgi:hypothetical protein